MRFLIILIFLSLGIQAQEDCPDCLPPTPPMNGPEWPVEFVKVHKEDYPRNRKAEYCSRPAEMLDTIVLHHSESPPTDSPQTINRYHLNRRDSNGQPWYMVAYSYIINTPYPGSSLPAPKITEGRPLDIVGAHAGSAAFVPMDEEQRQMWNDGKIICGKENGPFSQDPKLLRQGLIKANVTTLGVVVVGNYAPYSSRNPNGYSRRRPRYPTKATQQLIAKFSCQLQKKYPKIKNIKWHNYYHPTQCPGTIRNFIGQIKTYAKEHGCDFN